MLTWACPRCRGGLSRPQEGRLHCGACSADFDRRGAVWGFAGEFRPPGFPLTRHAGLQAIEEGHFWFEARDRLLARWLQRRMKPGPEVTVLDIGCGTGRFLSLAGALGYGAVGVDGHAEPLELASARCPSATLVHGDIAHVPFADDQFDVVVALDVLEHVETGPVLREVARVVRPHGGLLVSVPALPWLWSRMDELAGHRLRYTVPRLRESLTGGGWVLRSWTHYQCLVLPLVAISRLLSRRAEQPLERRPPASLNRLLALINHAEVRLLGGLRLPWGSSLIAWGTPS